MKETIYIFSHGRLKRKDNTLFFETEDDEKKYMPLQFKENNRLMLFDRIKKKYLCAYDHVIKFQIFHGTKSDYLVVRLQTGLVKLFDLTLEKPLLEDEIINHVLFKDKEQMIMLMYLKLI